MHVNVKDSRGSDASKVSSDCGTGGIEGELFSRDFLEVGSVVPRGMVEENNRAELRGTARNGVGFILWIRFGIRGRD